MITTQLNTGGSAVVPANGIATVTIGPNGLETWNLTTVAVSASTNTLEPTARVYVGAVDPKFLVGSTYTGSLDSGPDSSILPPGQKIICVWNGADVGATVTLSVYGTKTA